MQVDLLHADLQPLQVLRPQLVHLELASYHETLSWCTGAHLAWKCTRSHLLGCAHPGCQRLAITSIAQQFRSYPPCSEDRGMGAICLSCEPLVYVSCRLHSSDVLEPAGMLLAAASGPWHAEGAPLAEGPRSQ